MDLLKAKENLEKRGYTVRIFDTCEEAAVYLDESIRDTTVGTGGSMTLDALNIL